MSLSLKKTKNILQKLKENDVIDDQGGDSGGN